MTTATLTRPTEPVPAARRPASTLPAGPPQSVPLEQLWEVAAVALDPDCRTRAADLQDWQVTDAIAAMTALGDSGAHIAHVLQVRPDTLRRRARQSGIKLRPRDARVDAIGVLVAMCGGRIALRRNDRQAAIRALAAQGLDAAEIGRRLASKPSTIRTIAARIGVYVTATNASAAARSRQAQAAARARYA